MNNSLINRNTTILVLVILVLGFIFMNLENNKSMTGGAVDCESFIPIVKKMIAKDSIYSYTIGSTPGLIIYIILTLILIYIGYIFARYDVLYNGLQVVPGYNAGSSIGLSGHSMITYATGALYKFYIFLH